MRPNMAGVSSGRRRFILRAFVRQIHFRGRTVSSRYALFKRHCYPDLHGGLSCRQHPAWFQCTVRPWEPFKKFHTIGRCQASDVDCCALSLSSSESENRRSPSRSLSGDTTEEGSSTHSNNNKYTVPQQEDPQQGDAPTTHDHGVPPTPQYGGKGSQSGDSNIITLKCVAELDVRVESLDRKLTDQRKGIEDVRRGLADLLRRLNIIETEAEERTRSELTHTADEPEQKTARTNRRSLTGAPATFVVQKSAEDASKGSHVLGSPLHSHDYQL